jgi:hypothetical protein
MADEKKPYRFDATDALAVIGIALVSYGAWLMYPPAAFIVAGALILCGAIVAARR